MDFLLGGMRFPLTPSELTVSVGAQVKTWNIIQLGEISFPRGRQARKYQFTAILPGEDRVNIPYVKSWTNPQIFRSQLDNWCETGQTVQFVVSETNINQLVYVQTVSSKTSGGFGDLECQIQLLEARSLTVATQDQTNATIVTANGVNPVQRVSNAVPSSYTTRQGDTLWGIAQRFYGDGSLWQLIYAVNITSVGLDPTGTLAAGIQLFLPGGS